MCDSRYIAVLIVILVIVVYYLTYMTEGDSSIEDVIKNNDNVFVAYTVSWCGYCKKLKPEFDKLIKNNKSNVVIMEFEDADKNEPNIEVKSYPTIVLFRKGKVINYDGGRTEVEMRSFIGSNI